tara:strand:- start:168 stop:584 length:417 start_codon:yes stop_codon:yes gene_type:complete
MAIQKHVFDLEGNAIYAETANINYFLNTALAPASQGAVVVKQSSVKASTRRRYPGDSAPSNVSATTRDYLYDPGRRNGSATPGSPFILDDGVEKRSFTFSGPFLNLHAFIVGDAKMDLRLYSPSASYEIDAASGGGGG